MRVPARWKARLAFLSVAAIVLLPGWAAAHDFVLWPSASSPLAPSGTIDVALRVGDHLSEGDERGYRSDRVARFALRSASGTRDLGADRSRSDAPFASGLTLPSGGHWLFVDRHPIRIEMEAERFDGYLRHERLTEIVAERRRRGESEDAGRERYTRHLKAFVQVGDDADGVGCAPLGQAFELVPRHDPRTYRAGQRVVLEVRLDGRPLAGQPIDAMTRVDGALHHRHLVSDGRGRIRVRFDHPGRWVLRGVHMRRCAEDCDEVEWESRWTALTVDVGVSDGSEPRGCGP